MNDAILIHELELTGRIGVTAEERAAPQRLLLSLTIWPRASFVQVDDDLGRTIDYAEICAAATAVVSTRSDKLIETLAEAVAAELLQNFPIRLLCLELRKFILPQVKYVAVRITRPEGSV